MKKLLFTIPTLGGGGAERVLVNLVNNFDKTKYDVTIFTLFDEGINKQYLNFNIKYISFFKKQIIYFLNPIKHFKEEVLNKKDKDGIH